MNGYELSRSWFDFCFENPEKVSPNHHAIFFFAIEHCNRLGWKSKFGFPTQMAMDAIGIKKHQTYIKYFQDLCDWKFFLLVQKSINQYSSNIISLSNGLPKNGKALDKAIINHSAKQTLPNGQSTGQSNSSIDKPNNQEPDNKEQLNHFVLTFDEFWSKYPKKVAKDKCKKKYDSLPDNEKLIIKNTIDFFIEFKPFPSYIHPNPETYLNQKRWNDEIVKKTNSLKITHVDPDNYGDYNQYLSDCKKHGIAEDLTTPEYYYGYGR